MVGMFTIDEAEDELGDVVYFVANDLGEWVDGPYPTRVGAKDRAEWMQRKAEGAAVKVLLDWRPVGFEFRLENVSFAYVATYRKNGSGLWDQVSAPSTPLVVNIEASHLGFVVGVDAIRKVLAP